MKVLEVGHNEAGVVQGMQNPGLLCRRDLNGRLERFERVGEIWKGQMYLSIVSIATVGFSMHGRAGAGGYFVLIEET